MADRRSDEEGPRPKRRQPATSPEARELQMISLAMDAAEKQILDGTASSQLLTHFVKLGSQREVKEQKRLELEAKLLEKKAETMETAERVEILMQDALKAFRGYQGENNDEIPDF